jgi:hypothetical protein
MNICNWCAVVGVNKLIHALMQVMKYVCICHVYSQNYCITSHKTESHTVRQNYTESYVPPGEIFFLLKHLPVN